MAKSSKALKALAVVFFVSGLYDTFGGFYYMLLVGTEKSIKNPPTHVFYSYFIASFLISFALVQFLAAFNIRRYMVVIGPIIIGRLWYAGMVFGYIFGVPGFPDDFLPTGIMDCVWSALYIVLTALSPEVKLKNLFVPCRSDG